MQNLFAQVAEGHQSIATIAKQYDQKLNSLLNAVDNWHGAHRAVPKLGSSRTEPWHPAGVSALQSGRETSQLAPLSAAPALPLPLILPRPRPDRPHAGLPDRQALRHLVPRARALAVVQPQGGLERLR